MTDQGQPQASAHQAGPKERVAVALTNLSKLAGLAIGAHEAFGQARPAVLLFATAVYMGAQAVEDLILKLIDKTFTD